MARNDGYELASLLDEEDLKFLEELAKANGLDVCQQAKEGIQQNIRRVTRPKRMPGKIQAFRARD